MTSRVQKWGNSLAVRIPKLLAVDANLAEGADVDLQVRDGALVVARTARKRYTLDELLGNVTPENTHAAVDWGGDVGREAIE